MVFYLRHLQVNFKIIWRNFLKTLKRIVNWSIYHKGYKKLLLVVFLVLIIALYNSFIEDIQSAIVNDLSFLFWDIKNLEIFHVLLLYLFLFLFFLIFGNRCHSYIKRLFKSFRIFGTIFQHYLVFGSLVIFISSLLLSTDTYQSYYFFRSDVVLATILIVLLATPISVYLSRKEEKLRRDKFYSEKNYIEKFPIQKSIQDKIGFEGQVSIIFSDIISYDHRFKAQSYLLLGEWGSGKTSLLNLLREKIINSEKDREGRNFNTLETIYFDVSQFEDTNILYLHFYNNIIEELSERFIIPVFDRYKIMQSIVGAFGKNNYLNSLISYFLSKQSPGKNLKKISRWLYSLNLTFVVQIDEIDRLKEQEINGVFKLIRLVKSNMSNIVLVSATTNKVLYDQLSELNK
nr:P-loop NTPase fold protein [Rhodohalobacter sp. 614A]